MFVFSMMHVMSMELISIVTFRLIAAPLRTEIHSLRWFGREQIESNKSCIRLISYLTFTIMVSVAQ